MFAVLSARSAKESKARTPVQAGSPLPALRHMARWMIDEERE
jgi:hypothetical protein